MGDLPVLDHATFGMPVVVGVDASAWHVLLTALQLAQSLGSRLVVVRAGGRRPDATPHASRRDARAGVVAGRAADGAEVEALLDEVRERADAMGVAIECVAREGTPANVVVDVAVERGAGLVVVGNRGLRGTGRGLAGDDPHDARCSVLIVDAAAALAA